MVSVSASVSLPLHHKVQKFSSGTGSPGWSQKKNGCGGGSITMKTKWSKDHHNPLTLQRYITIISL